MRIKEGCPHPSPRHPGRRPRGGALDLNFHLLGSQKPAGQGDRGGNRSDQRKRAARSVAESSTKQAFANAKVEIERLAAQLDKGQALDLRWTIIGLFVSAGGMWLSYWV
jgi:hypothetical protein